MPDCLGCCTFVLVPAERRVLLRDGEPAGEETEHVLSRLQGSCRGGTAAGIGRRPPPVLDAMDEPLASKTITLSCGKLTTGVTVRPWAGMLMLRKCSSPETYFQSAFRVQSPWTVRT